ncbi:primosomal replication protein N [Thalassotalea euphylliae]|uniref:primosomal replication protein N n=1 Tax=Thalassotalea euphylliae TaxID=1655234 RepID=UPI00364496DF
MIENCLTLIGHVVKTPKLSTTPAGLHHCQFSIEHRSIQTEDGLNRQAFVRMQVVATGDWSRNLASELTEGVQISVSGFINRHESRNGNPILVLHAQQIEMIN